MTGRITRLAMRLSTLLMVVIVLALPLSAQATFQWERYGDLRIDGEGAPAFDAEGRMLYAGIANDLSDEFKWYGLFSLQAPYDSAMQWVQEVDFFSGPQIWGNAFSISTDSILATGNGFYRSVDAGATWTRLDAQPNPYPRVRQWIEIPAGVPNAGRILGAADQSMAIYSDDRGASFQTAESPGSSAPDANADRLTVVTSGPNTGRILGAGLSGITKSDDGGQTWSATSEWVFRQMDTRCISTLRGQAPGGGDRLVTLINDLRIQDDSLRISLSDDGGETWRRPQAVLQGAFRTCSEIVDLGMGRAVAVLLRGPIYGTEDAGETWTKWSDWPGPTGQAGVAVFTKWATLGPDGHLYVGLSHNSAPNVFDVRTTVPVGMITANGPTPAVESRLTLSVRPNPSDGRVTVLLEAAEPGIVRLSVVDALGREVALLFDGPVTERREVPVETSGLAPGVYVVRASTAGFADVTSRFTVAR